MDMCMQATSEGMDREEPPKEILSAHVSGRLRVMKNGRGFKDRKFLIQIKGSFLIKVLKKILQKFVFPYRDKEEG
jgi:hypothetical protein